MSSKSAVPIKFKQGATMDDLRADVASLRDDLKAILTDVKDITNDQRRAAMVKGKSLMKDAGTRASSATGYVKESVRDNPLRAIGASFAAGLLIAALRK